MEFTKAIEKMIQRAGDDYHAWVSRTDRTDEEIDVDVNEFRQGFEIEEGRKYVKVIKTGHGQRSVWGFVVKEDGGKFLKGDILKAATWKSPATNAPRGNIFGEYQIRWTGPMYL